MASVHSTAIVSKRAEIGANVTIGPFTTVHDDVMIGEGTVVEGYCEIGYPTSSADGKPLCIGKDSRIRSHSVFYQGSTFGHDLVTGHGVVVREKTSAGVGVQIGTSSDIQGHCTIGNYTRMHSGVFVCQYSTLGSFVWLFPRVVLTEDPHPPSNFHVGVVVEDYAAVAASAIVLPGIRIGKDALVGAGSLVSRDVAPGMVVLGVPAKVICAASQIRTKDGSDKPAYPWRSHFHRGYPEEVVKSWLNGIVDFTPT